VEISISTPTFAVVLPPASTSYSKTPQALLGRASFCEAAQHFVEMDEKAVREENQITHCLSKSLDSADFTR
jgi:hypothetical protein